MQSMGWNPLPLPNSPNAAMSILNTVQPSCIVLTGGNNVLPSQPDYAPERNATERSLLDWCQATHIPVIGVCRGLQFMNWYLGGSISTVVNHVGTTHSLHVHGFPSQVNSFHDYGILADSDLAEDLEAKVVATDGVVEAAIHRTLPWIGFMWHPERALPDDSENRTWFANILQQIEETRSIAKF